MADDQLSAARLAELMAAPHRNETECQAFLPKVHFLLQPHFAVVVERVREQIGAAGRSDYFLVCNVRTDTTRKQVVLWEVKAPQCHLFKVTTDNRLAPTSDLVEAENQLLNYYDDFRSSERFRDNIGVTHSDDVLLGGLIIGRDDNAVQPSASHPMTPEKIARLYRTAYRIRTAHLYQRQFRLYTWTHIYDQLVGQEHAAEAGQQHGLGQTHPATPSTGARL